MLDLRAYQQHGYAILPSVFDDTMCKALIKTAKRLPHAQDGSFMPEMMPHRTHPPFMQAMRSPVLVNAMQTILEGEVCGLQTEFFHCRPGTQGFAIHQDNYFVEAPTGTFASAWCPLVDTHAGNGGLIVYPGTHRLGALPVRSLQQHAAGQDPNARREEAIIPKEFNPASVEVQRGTALLIHGELAHASYTNQSDACRYVLLITYIRRGVPFRAGQTAKREAITL